MAPGSGNSISKGKILHEFFKWGPNFRIEFNITVKQSAEICTTKVSPNFDAHRSHKKSYNDAKAYCENEGKELAYFEDEASFDKFVTELPYHETWVGAKLVNTDGSKKFQVMSYAVLTLNFIIK